MTNSLKGKKNFSKKIAVLKNKKPIELTLGERLTLLRIENGYTSQEKFGELFSLSKSAVNNYENDQAKPDYDTLQLMAERFNVSYDYLFGVSNSKIRETHNLVNTLGLSEQAVNRLIKFGKSKSDARIMNYLLESEQAPALIELLNQYVEASSKELEILREGSEINMETLLSANFYLNGIANTATIKYALIHCFTDIVDWAGSIGNLTEN